MKTFSSRTRELALNTSNGYCKCNPTCTEKATQFHHMLSNTKVNQKLYPVFLQSIFNCCPINHNCHMTKPLPKISNQAAAAFETFLVELRQFNKQK